MLLLISQFESTRIQEERLKGLEKEVIIEKKVKPVNWIDDTMLEVDNLLGDWEDPNVEEENLKLMKKCVFQFFRSFDQDDLQLISKEEFFELLAALGITFDDEQREYIYDFYDFNSDGLLKNSEVNQIIVQIMMGHVFFSSAANDRELRDEHHFDMALYMLYPEKIYDTIDLILKDFVEKDVAKYGCISLQDFNDIMWTYNTEESGFIQKDQGADPAEQSEFDKIKDLLLKRHLRDGEFFYKETDPNVH